MVSPLFAAIMFMLRFIKIAGLHVADAFQIWMVEGEKDFVEEYDEGPMARRLGALPPGMAAVDASIAECVEDALSVGHTDETLIKLLEEAARLGPKAQATLGTGLPGGFPAALGEFGGASGLKPEASGSVAGPRGLGPGPSGLKAGASGGFAAGFGAAPAGVQPMGILSLPEGQAPIPSGYAMPVVGGPVKYGGGAESDVAFADFMSAFRKEMQDSHDRTDNFRKCVPAKVTVSSAIGAPAKLTLDDDLGRLGATQAEDGDEEDAFEWPQECAALQPTRAWCPAERIDTELALASPPVP